MKDEEQALAELLAGDDLLLIGGSAGPFFDPVDEDDTPATIYVNCNDLFAWACAEALPLPKDEIGSFYKAWKTGKYGTTRWSCIKKNLQPQFPVRERMKELGRWDDMMEALPRNPDDKS